MTDVREAWITEWMHGLDWKMWHVGLPKPKMFRPDLVIVKKKDLSLDLIGISEDWSEVIAYAIAGGLKEKA